MAWNDNSTDETNFVIELHYNSSYSNQYSTNTLSANTTSFDKTGVPSGTYWARIRAYNAAGTSSWVNNTGNSITVL